MKKTARIFETSTGEATLSYPNKDQFKIYIETLFPEAIVAYSGQSVEVGRLWMVPSPGRSSLVAILRELGFSFKLFPDQALMSAHILFEGDFGPTYYEEYSHATGTPTEYR